MNKRVKCKKCGRWVEEKTYEGKLLGYYEEQPLSTIEKRVQHRLGIPFRTFRVHNCKREEKMIIKKPRCHLPWSIQANCQYAKGDEFPHSECQAPLDDDCRLRNTKWRIDRVGTGLVRRKG